MKKPQTTYRPTKDHKMRMQHTTMPDISHVHVRTRVEPYPNPSEWSPNKGSNDNGTSRYDNSVRLAVDSLFIDAGLDRERRGTGEWNPLAKFVRPGARVFVLCNFVQHRMWRESEREFVAKVTHPAVIQAVVEYLARAVGPDGLILVGNAPLQTTDWDRMRIQNGLNKLEKHFDRVRIPVEFVDLRDEITLRRSSGAVSRHAIGLADKRVVVLGSEAEVDVLYRGRANPRSRVTEYKWQKTEARHGRGRHEYVVNQRILDSDLVFSIPKLKTHQKVGVTLGIKGTVGTIASKDSLTHHRFGAAWLHGDEYPVDPLGILSLVSYLHDKAWSLSPRHRIVRLLRLFDKNVRRVLAFFSIPQAGAWHGNDTAWRMAIDLARIVEYADRDGIMREVRQRGHLCLIDGVVGGEGDGPLRPQPRDTGILVFGDSVASVDYVGSMLMGYNPRRIPIVRRAMNSRHRHPLVDSDPLPRVVVDGTEIAAEHLLSLSQPQYKPSPGWKNWLSRTS